MDNLYLKLKPTLIVTFCVIALLNTYVISQSTNTFTNKNKDYMTLEYFTLKLEQLFKDLNRRCPGEKCGIYKYEEDKPAKHCGDIQKQGHHWSGLYLINTSQEPNETPVLEKVYCDMDTDGGGWLVFQRRTDGSVDFYRNWNDYKKGFGDLNGEFWLGNDIIHKITKQESFELRIDVMDFFHRSGFAKYQNFSLGKGEDYFVLTVSSYMGTIGDGLGPHNGMRFSTRDLDQDLYDGSCAQMTRGAWWYSACHSSNLNGYYYVGGGLDGDGVTWYPWHNAHVSLRFTEMKIRPSAR